MSLDGSFADFKATCNFPIPAPFSNPNGDLLFA
jgi:hypothetical protein